MNPIYSFGEWMKRRRKRLDLTQRELAEVAHCSVVTIKKIESDQRRPSGELAQLLARALVIPEDQTEVFIACARGQRPVDHLERGIPVGKERDQPGSSIKAALPPLPVAATTLIGRQFELELLDQLLANSWLVTIVGMGGVGKTRLALAAAADRQRKGQVTALVSLVELNEEDNLAAALMEALGLKLAADTDPTDQLLAYLLQKSLLLVMDNFEHLLGKAPLLVKMHQAAPGLTVIVTSREPLRLPGEQLMPVEGLQYPVVRQPAPNTIAEDEIGRYPAVQLYMDHARRLIPGIVINDEVALRQLCQITEGLPLALELAAAWADTLTLSDYVMELKRSLDVLVEKQPTLPARHQSVRAVFDTTWQLLGRAEQEAFARLSVFRGGFTRQAAESVTGINLGELGMLVGRHLVRFGHENSRYTLHELMRQYGAEKLSAMPDNGVEVRQRHARFFGGFISEREASFKNANQMEALVEIRSDRANIWAAFRWATAHPGDLLLANFAAALGNVCQLSGWIDDGFQLFTQAIQSLSPYRQQPDVVLTLSHLQVWRCRFAFLMGLPLEDLLAATRSLLAQASPGVGLRPVLAHYHFVVGGVHLDAGNREAAQRHTEKALGLYEGQDDEWGEANALAQLGTIWWNLGNYVKARNCFEESLFMRRQIGDNRGIAASLDRLGLLCMHEGQMELSSHYLEQAIDRFEQLGDRSGLADATENLGSAWMEMGRLAEAYGQYMQASALFDELGLRHTGYTVLMGLNAYLSAHLGEYERAYQEGEKALALSREHGHKRSEGLALVAQGITALALGREKTAAANLASGAGHLQAVNQREELAIGVGAQALVAFRQEQYDRARQFVLSSLDIVTRLHGLPQSPDYALAAWALLLARKGDADKAAGVYQLVLAEPFGAASWWFADMCGRLIQHEPPSKLMSLDERWEAIDRLYQALKEDANGSAS